MSELQILHFNHRSHKQYHCAGVILKTAFCDLAMSRSSLEHQLKQKFTISPQQLETTWKHYMQVLKYYRM
jgi:hypothetical protein